MRHTSTNAPGGKLLSAFKSALDARLRFDRLTVPSLSRETDEGTGIGICFQARENGSAIRQAQAPSGVEGMQGRREEATEGVFETYVYQRAGRQVAIGFQEGVRYKARALRKPEAYMEHTLRISEG